MSSFGGTSDLILPLNEQLLYSIDLTSFACTSIAIPVETDEALALHPYFSQGVWGLTMSAYPDTDAQFLFLFGGQSTDVSGEAPISMWSSTMVMYNVGADAWSVLSQSETVETTGLLPTGRRSLSVSAFPDSDGARFVFFGMLVCLLFM